MRRIGLLVLAAAGGACSEAPRPPDPRVWTLFDVQALYAGGKDGTYPIATSAGLPGGIALDHILVDDGTTLPVRDGVDFYSLTYVTTEVWTGYDRVWLQPMYVLSTVDPSTGQRTAGSDVQPIFSVGPRSGFYSPFWQTIYVDVPAGTTAESLASVRQIIGSGYPLRPGPGRTVSLVPDGVAVDATGTAISGMVTPPETRQGWLNGAPITFIDFGRSTFTWDENGVIAETPLYHFVAADDKGVMKELEVPAVAGLGPPHANATAPMIDGVLRYPSYWRIYSVDLPPVARVFAPPQIDEVLPGLRDQLMASMSSTYSAAVMAASTADLLPYLGHVAIDPSCFATPTLDLETCTWLDTQAHIERYLDPSTVEPTAITVTCPVVSVALKPVSPGAW